MAAEPTQEERKQTNKFVRDLAVKTEGYKLGDDVAGWPSELKQRIKAHRKHKKWFIGWRPQAMFKCCERAIKYKLKGPGIMGRPKTAGTEANVLLMVKILVKRPGLSVGDARDKLESKVLLYTILSMYSYYITLTCIVCGL